jgi:PAS domain S-box-containing protein
MEFMEKTNLEQKQEIPSELESSDIRDIGLEMLPNLIHNLPGMAYRCQNDSKWSMLFISEGCVDLTGYKVREILHNEEISYDSLIFEEDRGFVRNTIREAVEKRIQFQMEYRIVNRSGDIRWVWEKGNAVYDKNHNPAYLDGFVIDITARKTAEEALKRAVGDLSDLNATKDRFFSLVAHDLQNPVYAIISLSEFIAENYSSFGREEIQDALLQVNSAAQGIFTLLENLLDWARLQTNQVVIQKEMVSLSKTLRYAIDHYQKAADQKGISVEIVAEHDVMIDSDLKLVSSIFRNLISNALKYSYPKGKVVIHLWQEEERAMVSVRDYGVGIPRKSISKLFRIDSDLRQYGTANESGSGLGLILADSFAKLLGAEMKVESKLNHGSTFTLIHPKRI